MDDVQRMTPADAVVELGAEWQALDDILSEMCVTLPIWEKGDGDDSYEHIEAFRGIALYVAANPPDPTNAWAQRFLLHRALGVMFTLTNGSTLEVMIDWLYPHRDPEVRQHFVNFLGLIYGLCRATQAQDAAYLDTCTEILELLDEKCADILPLIKA